MRAEPNVHVSVVVVDDHALVRAEIVRILADASDIRVVGEACDGVKALESVEALRPDVVLMDVSMPEISGMEATRAIKWRWPQTIVLILSLQGDDEYVYAALSAGAAGCVLKELAGEQLVKTIRAAARYEPVLDPAVARRILPRFAEISRPSPSAGAVLNGNQVELLELVGRGWSGRKIANELGLPEPTVRSCLGELFRGLGVASPAEALVCALRQGLLRSEHVFGVPAGPSGVRPGSGLMDLERVQTV